MEMGSLRLGLCQRHADHIEEARQAIATAFTALSGLVRKPELRKSSAWLELLPWAVPCAPALLLST